MSKVSEDREFIKRCVSEEGDYFDRDMKKNHNINFFYVDAFLKYRPQQDELGIRRKIRNLSTTNILYSVYLSFKKVDKSFISKIEKIRLELSTRKDLFESVLDFLENNEIVYDDLYFWHPGLKYSDVFSLIKDLLPNLVEDYKKYLVERLILGEQPKMEILEIFKNRLNRNLGDFDVIKKDLTLFKIYQDYQYNTEYEDKPSVGMKRKGIGSKNYIKRVHKEENNNKEEGSDIPRVYKVVTASFWKENDEEEEVYEASLKIFRGSRFSEGLH